MFLMKNLENHLKVIYPELTVLFGLFVFSFVLRQSFCV